MPHSSILQLLAWIGLGAGVAGSMGAAVWWYLGADRIEALRPEARLRRLVTMAALPVLSAVYLLGLVVFPSLLDVAGIVSDHCHVHPNHHVHLCLLHGGHAHVSALGWVLPGAAGLWFGGGALWQVGRYVGALVRLRPLFEQGRRVEGTRLHVVGSDLPFALTTGLWSPRIAMSEALYAALDDRERRVVVDHERAHGRWHTILRGLVAVCGMAHLPAVGRWLRREVEVACEQIADRRAADEIGDPLEVAETILRVERLAGAHADPPVGGMAFGDGELERRITGLVDEPWREAGRWGLLVGAGLVVMVGLAGAGTFHHLVETLTAMIV